MTSPTPGNASRTTAGPPPAEIKLAATILVQLNIVRKNIRIYADGHPALQASAARTLQLLEQFLARVEAFSLTVTRDSLSLDEYEFPRGNPIVAEFVTYLHDQSIYVFTLKRGLTGEEFLQVNRLLAGQAPVAPGGSLEDAIAEASHGHAEVRLVDWGVSEFTDETRIDLTEQLRGESGETSWESFIRQLLQSALAVGNDDSTPVSALPATTATEGATGDRAAAQYLRDKASAAAGPEGAWHRVLQVATCVAPGLRPELLRMLRPSAIPATAELTDLLDERDAQLTLDALERVNTQGILLHPKVLKVVERLATGDPAAPRWRVGQLDRPGQQREFTECVTAFFTARDFPPAPVLLAEQPPAAADEAAAGALASEMKAAALAHSVAGHYATTLLDLIQRAPDARGAELSGRTLAAQILLGARAGAWDTVALIWQGLNELAARTEGPPLGALCQQIKTQFGSPEPFSELATAALSSVLDADVLGEILRLAGESQAPRLVDAFIVEKREANLRTLRGLIIEFKVHTLPHVMRLLDDGRPAVVCRLLALCQRLGDPAPLRKVEALASHADPEIRLEALRTAAVLKSPRAGSLVLRAMEAPDEKVSLGAIGIAPLVGTPDVTNVLLTIATASRWSKQSFDLPRKIESVRALAVIGTPPALVALRELATARPLFHGKQFRRLRVELFRGLTHADPLVQSEFAQLGRRIKDPEIAVACRELERRAAAKAQPPGERKETSA